MRTDWPASYLDGQTAIRHPATIRLMREGLEVTTAGGWARFWPYREIRQTQGFYEGEEIRLERGGELAEALLISDIAFLISLHELAPQLGARFHDPARRARRVRLTILAALGVVALTVACYLWGIPALAAVAAARVPVSWEQSVGQSAMSYLAPPGKRCEDPRLLEAVEQIVARLTAATPRSAYSIRVVVANVPVFNAVAVPGGHIVVFRGLLERTRSPEELAGVLAHELQHVLHRHATRAVIQEVSTGLLVSALTGDLTGPLAYGLQTANTLGRLRYSRRAEEEADRDGMKMLLAARIDPAGMIDFFQSMLTKEGQVPAALRYLSTHPGTADRIARLKAMTARAGERPVKLLPDVDWAEIARRC